MPKIKKRYTCSACAIIFACWFPTAHTADSKPIDGAGTSSCGEYLEHSADQALSKTVVSWAQGFLSGMNLADRTANKAFVFLPDALSIQVDLEKFCTDNPGATPFEGSILLYKKLRRNQ